MLCWSHSNDVIHTIQGTIGQYFATIHCVVCGRLSVKNVCSLCTADPQKVATVITNRIQSSETSYHKLLLVSIHYLCMCVHTSCVILPSSCAHTVWLAGMNITSPAVYLWSVLCCHGDYVPNTNCRHQQK